VQGGFLTQETMACCLVNVPSNSAGSLKTDQCRNRSPAFPQADPFFSLRFGGKRKNKIGCRKSASTARNPLQKPFRRSINMGTSVSVTRVSSLQCFDQGFAISPMRTGFPWEKACHSRRSLSSEVCDLRNLLQHHQTAQVSVLVSSSCRMISAT